MRSTTDSLVSFLELGSLDAGNTTTPAVTFKTKMVASGCVCTLHFSLSV